MEAIACTLTASDMPARQAEIRAIGAEGLRGVDRREDAVVLRFDPSVGERVAAVVAAEQQCCAFLGFALEGDTLTITAPPGGEPVMHGLADLFAGRG